MSALDSGHFGVFGVVRRARWLWTDEEKRWICVQTTAPDVFMAQVARRYALNANMMFKWLGPAQGVVEPDNNTAERATRAVALGRKN